MTIHSRDNNIPLLNGLVLAGGKSSRMGEDKGVMQWFGKEHRYFLADMLTPFCNSVYISCREDQKDELVHNHYQCIPDAYPGCGPLGAILSAFQANHRAAWLVVACDLPLLNQGVIQQLVNERDAARIATSFKSPHDHLPEPLLAIWEPAAREFLLQSLSNQIRCPRKVLNEKNTKIVIPEYPEALLNANTPEDASRAKRMLFN